MKRLVLCFALAFTFLLPVAPPAVADTKAEVLARIEAARQKAIRDLRLVIAQEYDLRSKAPSGVLDALLGDSNPDLVRYRRQLDAHARTVARAESAYRQVLSAELITATRGMSKEEANAYLYERSRDANAAYRSAPRRVRGMLAHRLNRADGDEEKNQALGFADGLLRTSQIEEEMMSAAMRRHAGSDDYARLKGLMQRAAGTRVTLRSTDIADPVEREAEIFVRKARMDAQIAEYRRLAQTGRVTDPATGQAVTGQHRIALARDAEAALAAELEAKALKPNRYDILGWMLSEPERRTASKQIAASVAETPEYNALDYLGGARTGDKSIHYQALAQAVLKQRQGVQDWRAGFVKDTDATGLAPIDETINVVRTGTADFNRILGSAGTMSLDQVDARIARYNTDADSVVAAFQEAAALERAAAKRGERGDPRQLSPGARALLEKHGYVARDEGQAYFTIPTGRRSLGGLKADVNLPGDHLLNQISGQNMLEIAATSYIPAATAGRVGKLLEGLNVGTRGVQAATAVTDLVAGVALDSGLEYAKTGKVDPARLAIEATLLQSTLGVPGRLTGAAVSGTTRKLSGYISSPGVLKATEKVLTEGLGLGSEAALQSYYQASVQGTGVSYETFLANALNGAMSRGVSRVMESSVVGDMSSALRTELDARQRAVEASKKTAAERLNSVLGDDLTGRSGRLRGLRLSAGEASEAVTARMADALGSGDMTWSELKLLYADNPRLKPLLQAVADHRAEYFQNIVGPAQRMAEADLNVENDRAVARIRETMADNPAQMRQALARQERTYQSELDLIRVDPRAPGSKNVTSDIDRSIASERVRRKLKEIYRGDHEGFEVPATSAQSYDVNEYIDVFPVINKTLPRSAELAGLDVADGDFAGLNHEQAMETQGLATAMLHMNAAQRDKFRENTLADAADPEFTRRQLDLAEASLDRGARELRTEMDRLAAENPNLARNQGDLAIRARDNLYGQRTEAIRQSANELLNVEADIAALREDGVAEDAPRLAELRAREKDLNAEIQRKWGFALREGIETYASFTGLDAIVNDGQIPEGASIRKLIDDPDYRRLAPGEEPGEGGGGKTYSDSQLRNFMNDQVMMMTHHMNGFHEGHEGVADAGSALGKYAERAVLALKLQGKDLTQPPFRDLNEISKVMVEKRKDPAALQAYMKQVGRRFGDAATPEAGLLAVAEMVQKAVPQTRGLWDPDAMRLSPEGAAERARSDPDHGIRTQLANRRHLLREEEDLLLSRGPASAAGANRTRMTRLDDELATLKARKAQRQSLGSRYLPEHWEEAERLEAESEELRDRVNRVRDLRGTIPYDHPAYKKLRENGARLSALSQAYRDAGGSGVYAPDETDARIDARIAGIEEEMALRRKAAERYESLEEEATERRAALEIPDAAAPLELPADGFDPARPGQLRVSLGTLQVSVPVTPRAAD
ncbi:MAG: hypothetical protein ACU0DK_09945 [Pseudooceanicola sp.]